MNRFDKLYEVEKSQKFMLHIIHSFSYPDQVSKVWNWRDDKKTHRCSFCKRKVMSCDEATKIHGEGLLKHFEEKKKKDNSTLEDLFPNFQDIFGDKKLAIESEKSNAIFCFPCFTEFRVWLFNKMLLSDERIHKVVNKVLVEAAKKNFGSEEYQNLEQYKKDKKKKKNNKKNKEEEKEPSINTPFAGLKDLLKKK